ncbi:hypothetical protein ACFE04_015784 [Oxalis oulophora]
MVFTQASLSTGLTASINGNSNSITESRTRFLAKFHNTLPTLSYNKASTGYSGDAASNCHLSTQHTSSWSPLLTYRRRRSTPVIYDHLSSDCELEPADVDDEEKVKLLLEDELLRRALEEAHALGSSAEEKFEMNKESVDEPQPVDVKRELILLSLPAIAGQAIDPLAQLMETAYIGRLGHVELASAGVSISIFNIISKLFNIPLLSVATSFVAEDIAKNVIKDSPSGKRNQLSSVSTALLLAIGIGIFESVALSLGSGPFLNLMGIPMTSEMYAPAKQFLSLRALGAPAVVLSLALQGIFRGFKDTKTPVICLGIGNISAVALFPLFMFYQGMGFTGAALSVVVSQYIVALLMLWYLSRSVELMPPNLGGLQFGSYIKSGGFLLGRTLAVLVTMTIGTSMAARQGPVAMAAHQICMQVWLAVSLLTDALAASGQALVAINVSKGDFTNVKKVTNYVLKIGLVTGILLAVVLGLSFDSLATLFTKDANVLAIVRTGVLFVSASQPINSLAFIFDGLHYGVSDFPYAAWSMILVGVVSSAFLLYIPSIIGLPGVWCGLTLFMGLRMAAGFYRIQSKTGPWWFLHPWESTKSLR